MLLGSSRVVLLAADAPARHQLATAFEVGIGQLHGRLGVGDRPLGGLREGRVGPRVNLVEELARLDLFAVCELDLLQVAGHPRLDVHGGDGGGSPGELLVGQGLAWLQPSHRDNQRGLLDGRLVTVTAGQDH